MKAMKTQVTSLTVKQGLMYSQSQLLDTSTNQNFLWKYMATGLLKNTTAECISITSAVNQNTPSIR